MDPAKKARLCKDYFIALSKRGKSAIIDVAYSHFKRPILVVDSEYNLIAQVPNEPIGDYVWDTLLMQKAYSPELLRAYVYDFSNSIWATDKVVFMDWGLAKNYPRLAYAVKINGKVKAMLEIYCKDRAYTVEDIEGVEIFALALSVDVSRTLAYAYSSVPLLTTFFKSLIKGDAKLISYYREILAHTGVVFAPAYCIAAARFPKSFHEEQRLTLCERLSKSNTHLYPICHENMLYMLYEDISGKKTYSAIIATLESDHCFLRQSGFEIGISEVFDDLADFNIYSYQAKHALELGSRTQSESGLYQFRDFVLYDILSYAKANIDLKCYIHPAIPALEKFDAKKKPNTA